MDIRSACAKLGQECSEARTLEDFSQLSEEAIAGVLAKDAAAVAKLSGLTEKEVQYEGVGAYDCKEQPITASPSLADNGPKFMKSKEHRHWYTVGQSSSYYEALVAQQLAAAQPTTPKSLTPAMLLQRVLADAPSSPAGGQSGSARSSSSSSTFANKEVLQ